MNSIKTNYAGTEFRSRMEADIAQVIRRLGYEYKYEPISFLMDSGVHYWPDFYIPDINLWIEVRGYESEKGEQQVKEFSEMVRDGRIKDMSISKPDCLLPFECDISNKYCDYMVVRYDRIQFFECLNRYGTWKSEAVSLIQCKCGRHSFIGDEGCYQCRRCGEWNGDEHIAKVLNFSDIDELKNITKFAGGNL